jgi:hypothetical protein
MDFALEWRRTDLIAKGLCQQFAATHNKIVLREPVFMEYIAEIWEKLTEWANELIEILLGQEPQPEPELIPIPVRDR